MSVLSNKISVAGLNISTFSKKDLLELLEQRSLSGQKTTIVTPYSEFLSLALRDKEKQELFNSFDVAIPDGVGIFFAERFLSENFNLKSYYGKVLEAGVRAFIWLSRIILTPKSLYKVIPEKISGADFIWDLCALAEKTKQSIFLAGGFGDTPKRLAEDIKKRFPNIIIAGFSNKNPNDLSLVEDIRKVSPDIILASLGPKKQEEWIIKNYNLNFKIAIGLGGSFDYAVGDKINPPKFFRKFGLEWLFRLITQPHRYKRIYDGVVTMVVYLIRLKVFLTMPFRKNVVVIILNKNKEILVCQRNPHKHPYGDGAHKKNDNTYFQNYWQFPQGGIDKNEDLEIGARREAFEEVGLKDLRLISQSHQTFSYLWQNATRRLWFNPLKFKGQTQTLLYFSHENENEPVKIDYQEFINYSWEKLEDLENKVNQERLPLVEIIKADFVNFPLK